MPTSPPPPLRPRSGVHRTDVGWSAAIAAQVFRTEAHPSDGFVVDWQMVAGDERG